MASYRKRGEKWYYTITIKDKNGKWKNVERAGGRTKKECKAAYRDAMRVMDATGVYEEPSKILVKAFLTDWLETSVKVTKKANTYKSYESVVRIHLIPAFGSMHMQSVTPKFLQQFINEKKESGLSRASLKVIVSALKTAFTYAVSIDGCISTNPSLNITIPRYEIQPEEVKVFTPSQMDQILSRFSDNQLHMAILCAYHLGLREGECCALRWSDIDMDSCMVAIHATMLTDGTIQGDTKTYSSCRTLPFGKKFLALLQEEKLRQNKLRLQYGPWWQGADFVCIRDDGKPLTLNAFRYFNVWAKKQFGYGTFHTLRHTHATYLLESGMELELVSKRLGHSSIVITAKTYSHILDKRTAQTVSYLDTAL